MLCSRKTHWGPESYWRRKRLGQGKSQETTEIGRTSCKWGSGSGKEVRMPYTWGPLSCRERLLWEHLKVLPWPASPSDSRRYTVCLAEDIAGQQLPGMLLHIHTCQRRLTSPWDRFSWKASVMAHTNSCMFSTLFNTRFCCCSRQPFQPGLHSGGGALGGGVPVNMADGSLWSLDVHRENVASSSRN